MMGLGKPVQLANGSVLGSVHESSVGPFPGYSPAVNLLLNLGRQLRATVYCNTRSGQSQITVDLLI